VTAQTDPLDVLVVGGGPGGTAVAFRALELGIRSLVVDFDDLMKRIRDYSKEKLILPSFGGGDRMRFPAGGELVSALRFAPIDKDEMVRSVKELYERHGVPYRTGIELMGLERRGEVWEAEAWDHGSRTPVRLLARHVVLALGRGVPRRFDVPGSCDGVALRLTDPALYVGRPACVVGGGTSAAEAVIAISNAKAAADDKSEGYWSYRGDRMPRVSKALADAFFEAYVGNGNVRYFPRSEPAAVVTGEDREEYLAVRVDRRRMEGRPTEALHLEFQKDCVVACIGEDLPVALLDAIGIPQAVGPSGKKRMAVTRHLETVQPGIFLVGDVLSQSYLEADDFGADPAGYREVRHPGNVKSALRDGVLVAEAIRQKLDGKAEIDVRLGDLEDLPGSERPAVLPLAAPSNTALPTPVDTAEEPAAVKPSAVSGGARLVRITADGLEADEYPLRANGAVTIGREGCDLDFPGDTSLSPRHASIVHDGESYSLRDEGSATGVFLRLSSTGKTTMEPGDLVSAGRQFLLLEGEAGRFKLIHYNANGREIGRHALPERTIVLGRQAPDVTLDSEDRTLSRRQLAVLAAGGRVLVKDLKSANGTYLRLRGARTLEHGARLRIGRQRFIFSSRPDAVLDAGEPERLPAPPPATAAPVEDGALTVTFLPAGKTCGARPGQTICEVAEANGVVLQAECHAGICGSDPVRIVEGQEFLAGPPDDQESETLEEICELKPGEHRLACQARIRGPVTVEVL